MKEMTGQQGSLMKFLQFIWNSFGEEKAIKKWKNYYN